VKILVAEDDRDIADLIAHYVHRQGWQTMLSAPVTTPWPTPAAKLSISSS
jgi:DNA-binding response OmpR family regulator